MTGLKQTFDKVSGFLSKYHIRGIYILMIFYVIVVAILRPQFMGLGNWMNIVRQVAVWGILSCGITFVMLTGRTELSAGMMITFLAALSCYFVIPGMDNQFLAIVLPLVLGTAFGLLNGLLVGVVKLNSFVATLGMMSLFNGAILLLIRNVPMLAANPANAFYRFLGQGSIVGIPVPAIILAVVAVVCTLVLKKTVFGQRVYAVGSNVVSARFSGIHSTRIVVAVYAISGFLTGLGALVMSARIMSAQPKMGAGYEFTALTAIVLGGTSIMGGKGSILGTIVGVLILGIIDNSFTILGLNPYLQYVVKGAILVAAVAVQVVGERRGKA